MKKPYNVFNSRKSYRILGLFGVIAFLLAGLFFGWRSGIFDRVTDIGKRGIDKALSIMTPSAQETGDDIPFDYVEIDNNAGDVKMVGDIDGDGYPDLVIGGMPDEKLNWYRYPDWGKTVIATPNTEFTTDAALGDVDDDGDLDIVTPDGDSGDNLVWFENPQPEGDPADGPQWQRHAIGSLGSWGKDIELGDFDGNGNLDIAARTDSRALIYFQTGAGVWSEVEIPGVTMGSEGMASGDIDNDDDIDLVFQGVWIRNPGGAAAQNASNWNQFNIGDADPNFKALVVDLNQDGVMDVVFSSSEGTADVNWWEPASGDPTGSWTKHTVQANLNRCHTLQAADMDLDGDMDLVLGQMHTSSDRHIMVYLNDGGQALSWSVQIVDDTGLHNGVVADIGNDGDYDIYGANWTGNPPVKLWENKLDTIGVLDRWTYNRVSDAHVQTFGLAFGDLNIDGHADIVSGPYWYANPGGDLIGNWDQHSFPQGMQAFLVADVDDDEYVDVFAQKDEGDIAVYWLEAQDGSAASWGATHIGTVPRASHELGAQGYRAAQIEAGGRLEILISSGNGIYYFHIPQSPEIGNWPKVHIHSNPSDEGFAIGDVDRDGDLDVVGTTGDSKRVEWYENPGDGNDDWAVHVVGTFEEAVFPDRAELADLNGDGRLDVIVTEENGTDQDAQTFWWSQPADPEGSDWAPHLIVSQATTNSMDVADMDQDGHTDIVLAEHRGSKKLSIWVGDGTGQLSETVVDTGMESHLGARIFDLDGDGDLDIVSIAWDAPEELHLWRNDQTGGITPVPTPLPSGRVMDGLAAWYTFREGEGDVVVDQSEQDPPINLDISDLSAVTWLQPGGLRILSPVRISTADAPARLIEACQTNNEITLEAWITPANNELNGPARIISLSEDAYNRNFTLGQEYDTFDVRLRTTTTSINGVPSITSPTGTAEPSLMHLVYVRDADGSAHIYKNNSLLTSGQIGGFFTNWSGEHRLILANEFADNRQWLGTLWMTAIYCKALSPTEVGQNYRAGSAWQLEVQQFIPITINGIQGLHTTVPASTVSTAAIEGNPQTGTLPAIVVNSETHDPILISNMNIWLFLFVALVIIGGIILGILVLHRNKPSGMLL